MLWTPSPDADENLLAEGIPAGRISRVGNIMLDSFELVRPAIEAADVPGELGLERGGYGVVTLHRPSNVDEPAQLIRLVDALIEAQRRLPLVFPVHPRTAKRLAAGAVRRPPRPGRDPADRALALCPLHEPGDRRRGGDHRFAAGSRRRRPISESPA